MAAGGASQSRIRETASGLDSVRLLCQAIAQAAHREDLDAAGFQLAPQPVHVDLDRVAADLLAPLAQVVDELLLADHASGSMHQDLEQREFARRKVELLLGQMRDLA